MVLIFVVTREIGDTTDGAHQRHTTAGHHALFDRGTGGVQRIFDTGFLLFHFDFRGRAHLDHGNATGQFGHALLQLLAVVVGRGVVDLHADFVDARVDPGRFAGTVDDGGVVLVHGHALGGAQVLQGGGLQIETHFLGNHRSAGQDGDILEHGFASVAEARRLAGGDFDDTAHVVDHQRGQRLAFHVFGHEHQRF